MRYLVHSTDATLDATDGRWYFNLDTRISNPREFVVRRAGFTKSTSADDPHVVYMRSDALHDLTMKKHTVRLKDARHEDAENVIAVLEERHTTGRYSLMGRHDRHRVRANGNVRKIDVYFTDNATLMPGTYVVPSQPSVTDAAVLALPDMLMMLDWDHTANVLPANIQTGTDITSIHSRVSPTSATP